MTPLMLTFWLSAFLLMGVSTYIILDAEAQLIPVISIQVAQDVYNTGDIVHVHGTLQKLHGGAVTIQLLAPNGNIIAIGQITPTERNWQYSIPAEFDVPGTYIVQAQYTLTKQHLSTDVFSYTIYQQGDVQVAGTNHTIRYTGDVMYDAYTSAEDSVVYSI
jgi:hypothetical protein